MTKQLRQALGRYPTGVAIVSARGQGGAPVGMTINSFTSLSLDPPLVGWALGRQAASYAAFAAADRFAISVLAEGQRDLAMRFATRGADKFEGLDLADEAILIPGAAAHLECLTHDRLVIGDHLMLVGWVDRFSTATASPLIFACGDFHPFPAPQLGAAA